jgi:hypothetical protein
MLSCVTLSISSEYIMSVAWRGEPAREERF